MAIWYKSDDKTLIDLWTNRLDLRMEDIATEMGKTKGQIAGKINQLVAAGLVKRRADMKKAMPSPPMVKASKPKKKPAPKVEPVQAKPASVPVPVQVVEEPAAVVARGPVEIPPPIPATYVPPRDIPQPAPNDDVEEDEDIGEHEPIHEFADTQPVNPNHCRWPMWPDKGKASGNAVRDFCQTSHLPGKPYCLTHMSKGYIGFVYTPPS